MALVFAVRRCWHRSYRSRDGIRKVTVRVPRLPRVCNGPNAVMALQFLADGRGREWERGAAPDITANHSFGIGQILSPQPI